MGLKDTITASSRLIPILDHVLNFFFDHFSSARLLISNMSVIAVIIYLASVTFYMSAGS